VAEEELSDSIGAGAGNVSQVLGYFRSGPAPPMQLTVEDVGAGGKVHVSPGGKDFVYCPTCSALGWISS
jgi:hypothetical protein